MFTIAKGRSRFAVCCPITNFGNVCKLIPVSEKQKFGFWLAVVVLAPTAELGYESRGKDPQSVLFLCCTCQDVVGQSMIYFSYHKTRDINLRKEEVS